MKCERCGAILQDDVVSCMYCGQILQRVPDYNPLEDVIADEVRNSIRQETSELTLPRDHVGRNVRDPRNGRNTGRMNPRDGSPRDIAAREAAEKEAKEAAEKEAKEAREQEIRKKREIERRRALKRKQRKILIASMCSALLLIIIIIVIAFNNSYSGQLSKGKNAISNGNYSSAIEHLEKALNKNDGQSEVYLLLADAYLENNEYNNGIYILMKAVEVIPEDIELHQALIDCYLSADDTASVKDYMDSLTDDDILEALIAYQCNEPEFGLAEGTYDDVQELIISSEEGTIYYTTDGTVATENSTEYIGGIQLSEGTTTVRAIVVNEEGISSDEVKMTYTVELPMEAAPVVTPSTGQYTSETYIAVTVPSGYTAYYTMDNTTPDTSSSVYTTPIEMPEGNTIFTVVLVSASGKYSDITKRNYDLKLPTVKDEEE